MSIRDIRQARQERLEKREKRRARFSSLTSNRLKSDSVSIGGGDDGLADLKKNIESMETIYALMSKLGNKEKANQIKASIDKKKNELEEAKSAPPPQQIDDELKSQVTDFINGKCTMPDGLSDENKGYLEDFASLAKDGMTFSNSMMQPMSFDDAFAKLVGKKFHGFGDQVMYTTSEGGMIKMSTLRPQYVKPLATFIKYSKKGFVFYDKTERGYQPVKTAEEFIKTFMDNPQDAVVEAVDGSFVTPDKAVKMKHEQELKAMIPDEPRERPEIVEKEDTVIIGGVVLKKRK